MHTLYNHFVAHETLSILTLCLATVLCINNVAMLWEFTAACKQTCISRNLRQSIRILQFTISCTTVWLQIFVVENFHIKPFSNLKKFGIKFLCISINFVKIRQLHHKAVKS